MAGELNNSQNWALAYQEYKQAIQATPQGGYYPLPAFEVPITFSSKILIAKTVSTIPAGKRWKWAGNLRAFQTFPNAGINSQKSEIQSYSLFLNRSKLLVLPEIASGYELVLSDAFWLRDLQLTIYEFTGQLDNELNQLVQSIQGDVLRIESKIDAL
ncbi:hypothetical protein NIES21_15190 [Anabaenopsis circularis NIES-21]|uniref:Uncharacterized protein n=1 Tax=Anabaenopsis circularis NIES-21 TaxID=1085406 RepID=A0A1Z4GDW2_9CYAN|nr:hypothetical protein NIES21_15190 [Anabaenopsis circularis NIES-21]